MEHARRDGVGGSHTAAGIARHYGSLVDGWVIDRADAKLQVEIERMGRRVLVTDTIMRDRKKSAGLAREVVAFTRRLAQERRR